MNKIKLFLILALLCMNIGLVNTYASDMSGTFDISLTAQKPTFQVFKEGCAIRVKNPIVVLSGKTYLAVDDIEMLFDIEVASNHNNSKNPDNISDISPKGLTYLDMIEKLNVGMYYEDVVKVIGKPVGNMASGVYKPIYLSSDKVWLIFDYDVDFNLRHVMNLSNVDCLADTWEVDLTYDKVLVNGCTLQSNNPTFVIGNMLYLPLKDLEPYSNISVMWNEINHSVEIREQ